MQRSTISDPHKVRQRKIKPALSNDQAPLQEAPPSFTAMLVILLPLIWLAVAAVVVIACQMAARADGRTPRPARDR